MCHVAVIRALSPLNRDANAAILLIDADPPAIPDAGAMGQDIYAGGFPMRPTRFLFALLLIGLAFSLSGCDTGPNGYGTAPPGVSQEEWDAQVAAKRQARRDFYRGPRGGMTGR
ncbi:hypothetical protein AVO45_00575 [Ruegeria marisrubri]|uniref:Uncharacterized protein n=1 Tax=Ruegeria marisrubri TaxID=1685379 RepID=A0A101CY60_9RHOB|nr:hypothetical protein [Ruegeria marisrubri]KUJ85527.1 hypothetical protein AVO45_00575 [Ruegeria marisrubri]